MENVSQQKVKYIYFIYFLDNSNDNSSNFLYFQITQETNMKHPLMY